jgi:methylenetetrahydrofolate reductase (NADPH)
MADGPAARVLAKLLSGASIEVSPGNLRAVAALRNRFAPGTEVFINFLPDTEHRVVVETASALWAANYEPVPHIVARAMPNASVLGEFLARLAGEAKVERVLLIAGDWPKPAGPFSESLNVIESGLLQKHGIRSVGLAGHPEGHPSVEARILEAALAAKNKSAAAAGLNPFVVTQFGFEAAPIFAWLARIRALGVDAPVRIGVAGPASIATLVKYSMRCGVGNSLRVLKSRPNMVGGLLGKAGPDELLQDLANGLASGGDARVEKVHFFPFGGVGDTGDFVARTLGALAVKEGARP